MSSNRRVFIEQLKNIFLKYRNKHPWCSQIISKLSILHLTWKHKVSMARISIGHIQEAIQFNFKMHLLSSGMNRTWRIMVATSKNSTDRPVPFMNHLRVDRDITMWKNQDTCYIDRCEDDPCNEGQECTWGWNDDEQSSWLLCDGEGEPFFDSRSSVLYNSDFIMKQTTCYIWYAAYLTYPMPSFSIIFFYLFYIINSILLFRT